MYFTQMLLFSWETQLSRWFAKETIELLLLNKGINYFNTSFLLVLLLRSFLDQSGFGFQHTDLVLQFRIFIQISDKCS